MSNRPQNYRGPKTHHELSSCITNALYWVGALQQRTTEYININDGNPANLTLFLHELTTTLAKTSESLEDAEFLQKLLPEHIQNMDAVLHDVKEGRRRIARAIQSVRMAEKMKCTDPVISESYLQRAKLEMHEAMLCTDREIEYPFNLPS